MKQKMSISVEEEKIRAVEEHIKKGIFRNKSHAIEMGLEMVLKSVEERQNGI